MKKQLVLFQLVTNKWGKKWLCSAIICFCEVDIAVVLSNYTDMYIRRTTIKSRKSGEPYYTYRLVKSVRTQKGVRQRTVLNLGQHFSFPRESWTDLAKRIEEIIAGQANLFQPPKDIETVAQNYAASI